MGTFWARGTRPFDYLDLFVPNARGRHTAVPTLVSATTSLGGFPVNRALRRWEWLTEWPLTISAVIFLVAYAAPIIDAYVARPWVLACRIVAWFTWTAFAVD